MKRGKKKSRYLRLEIKYKVPAGVTRQEVRNTLINSIRNGSYIYPPNWLVGIYWSNYHVGPLKSGEFRREMIASRVSSPGFDYAVIGYLENMP